MVICMKNAAYKNGSTLIAAVKRPAISKLTGMNKRLTLITLAPITQDAVPKYMISKNDRLESFKMNCLPKTVSVSDRVTAGREGQGPSDIGDPIGNCQANSAKNRQIKMPIIFTRREYCLNR